jgi:hypothetical protein
MEDVSQGKLPGLLTGSYSYELDTASELKKQLWGELIAVGIITLLIGGLTVWALTGI